MPQTKLNLWLNPSMSQHWIPCSGSPALYQQCCQFSQIIWETPDFGPYLPVSRLESDISWISTKLAISCRLHQKFPHKFLMWTVYVLYTSIRINEHFGHKYRHFSCGDIVYHSFPVNSQYIMTWGVDSPVPGLQYSQCMWLACKKSHCLITNPQIEGKFKMHIQ